jgi:GMP synthase (glutamine-hydrolysing)
MASLHRVLLLVTGPKPEPIVRAHGQFADLIRKALAAHAETYLPSATVAQSIEFTTLNVYETPDPVFPQDVSSFAAVIISGSKYNITEKHPWALKTSQWLRDHIFSVPATSRKTWVLGICFGHQLLADTLAATAEAPAVIINPNGPELGCIPVSPTAAGETDPLLSLPPAIQEPFPASLLHFQTVARLTPSAVVLAQSAGDRHQMVRWDERTYSVQFHPEYHRTFMVDSVPTLHLDDTEEEAAVLSSIVDAPSSESIIARFLSLATRS